MASSMLLFPRIVHMGGGARRLLPQVLSTLGLHRPLLVTDPFLYQTSDLVTNLMQHEWKSLQSPICDVFYETVPDPTSDVVRAGVERIQAHQPDVLVAVGGGSPMDTAKAMAHQYHHQQQQQQQNDSHNNTTTILPVVCIPTTAGTGSEMTRFAVITDSRTGEKQLLASPSMQPMAALVDYRLTLNLPPRVTADTGIDALVHAVEAYVSRKQHAVADMYCLEAIRLIGQALRPAYHGNTSNNNNSASDAHRQAMMRAASLAGLAFNHSSVALVHGMSRPLGAHFHWTHGASNAVLFPTLTQWSMQQQRQQPPKDDEDDSSESSSNAAAAAGNTLARYATVARTWLANDSTLQHASDAQAADRLVQELLALNQELNVPTLAHGGVDATAWHDRIPIMAQQALASGSCHNNPRIPTVQQVEELYRLAYQASW